MVKFHKKIALIVLSLMVALSCCTFSAYASKETFGKENPRIEFIYNAYSGNEIQSVVADGNNLKPGYYSVSVRLNGIDSISQFQFSAELDTTYASIGSFVENSWSEKSPKQIADLTDSYPNGFDVALVSLYSNRIECGFLSSNRESYTTVDSNGVKVLQFFINVKVPCDAEKIFAVEKSPNLTFLQTDYTLGKFDCYCLDVNASDAMAGAVLYPMSCDFSPELVKTFSVTAKVTVMSSTSGNSNGVPVKNAKITLDNGLYAYTDATGKFTLKNVPQGKHTAEITCDYGITRNVIIEVANSDINYAKDIPICACDFDENKVVSSTDLQIANKALSLNNGYEKYYYCDLDGNNHISSLDLNIVNDFTRNTFNYEELIIL